MRCRKSTQTCVKACRDTDIIVPSSSDGEISRYVCGEPTVSDSSAACLSSVVMHSSRQRLSRIAPHRCRGGGFRKASETPRVFSVWPPILTYFPTSSSVLVENRKVSSSATEFHSRRSSTHSCQRRGYALPGVRGGFFVFFSGVEAFLCSSRASTQGRINRSNE